jgi:membrane protein required for colicin V production
MNSLDWMLLAPLLVSGLLGVWRGVVREVMSVLAWVTGVVLAGRFAADLAQLLPINGDVLPHAVAWVLILLAVLIAAGLLARLLKQLLSVAGLGLADRLLGGVFGLVRGTMVLMLIVLLIGLTPFKTYPIWTSSQVVPLVQLLLEIVKPVLPVPLERLVT